MTRRCVTDEQYAALCRRTKELERRVDEGTLPFDRTMAVLQKLIEGKFVSTAAASYPITVNYDRTIEEMVAAGKYDSTNTDITTKNFPVVGKSASAVNIELVHFNRSMETVEVFVELDKQGLRPATLPELLAFGAKYPDKQLGFPIVALGSVWRNLGDLRVAACLCCDGSKRSLILYGLEYEWHAYYRFAAVRKESK